MARKLDTSNMGGRRDHVIVSLDESGNARAVAQWRPGCGEDQRLDRLAQRLVELRQFFEPCSSSTASAAITP